LIYVVCRDFRVLASPSGYLERGEFDNMNDELPKAGQSYGRSARKSGLLIVWGKAVKCFSLPNGGEAFTELGEKVRRA
jgi:hypothetical protein